MTRTLQTMRYLSKGFSLAIAIGFLGTLGCLAVTDSVFFLTDQYNQVHNIVELSMPFEFTSGIIALLIGLVLFLTQFKVSVANGISRKNFLLANLPAVVITAAALATINLVVVLIHRLFWPAILLSNLFYPNIDWAGSLIFQTALYSLLIITGWFITLAYYRSSPPLQAAITLAPVALYIVLGIIDVRTGGVVFEVLRNFVRLNLRQGPYRAALTLFAASVVLYGLDYLLIRRTPLKD